MSKLKKHLILLVLFTASTCVTCASSIAGTTEMGIQQSFHISHEVAILGISLYVFGLGCGPLLLGPLSEFYGRNIVYQVSYLIFFVFQFPIAFANSAAGVSGAAFLSVAGGSVTDIYDDASVANPMAVYTLGPFLGPVLGPGYAGVSQNYAVRNNGHAPPEARLLIGMTGAVIAPIITAYRPYAASAMAGNSFMRSSFAAVFPLFAGAMYNRLGTVGATALLAGLTTLMVPLP
ncbi:hypothetical protein Clacol_008242 [Clathrus columnatus]|uniref:Major facilitator superfamily (MFS) profile domain-containing protein n=1 Tax=Clathrus columnatus TaxID=1419009 RepID=A0AAV5AM98_9AGAM|nr:hypothetical protein Clacol_008242 [Clathrus columnatus]